jgi:hypothetical protein
MAKQQQEPKVERINRSTAANRVIAAINGKATLSELAAQADALFVEHGGKTRIKAAAYHVRRALETGEAMGVFKLTRPTDVMVERAKAK